MVFFQFQFQCQSEVQVSVHATATFGSGTALEVEAGATRDASSACRDLIEIPSSTKYRSPTDVRIRTIYQEG